MSYRRMWAALPAVALMSVALLAGGCAASTTAAAPGAPAVSQSSTGQGGTSGGTRAPDANPVRAARQPCTRPDDHRDRNADAWRVRLREWPSGVPVGPLPVAFAPVEVLRCQLGTTTVPGKGVFVSATLQRATKDLATLVAALRHPSGHMLPGTICPQLALIPPQIVLIDGNGAMISPRFPVNRVRHHPAGSARRPGRTAVADRVRPAVLPAAGRQCQRYRPRAEPVRPALRRHRRHERRREGHPPGGRQTTAPTAGASSRRGWASASDHRRRWHRSI